MNRVARLRPEDRRDLFDQTAAERGMRPAIAEKDFWVCWVLKQLFEDPELRTQMVFKGGTTLSKVHNLINRMSEDIDLVLDWQLLGYGNGQEDPYPAGTNSNQNSKLSDAMNKKANSYTEAKLLPRLRQLFAPYDGVLAEMAADEPNSRRRIRPINIDYPAEFKSNLRPKIQLEIGPKAVWLPSTRRQIRPYAAESFPALFAEPACEVVAIDLVRIFWEKATILHQEAHRGGPPPERYSRHYYDLYKLAKSEEGASAAQDTRTLEEVVEFKMRFFHSQWAKYETAVPGLLKLLPPEKQLVALRRDYAEMEEMIFGEVPSFDEILGGLRELEQKINLGYGRSHSTPSASA